MEVCPLSRRVMFQPLSVPLQNGFRFLHPRLPAALSAYLAARFPMGEPYGLTTFPLCTCVGEVSSLRRGDAICDRYGLSTGSCPHTFWSKRDSIFRLF